MYDFLDPQTSRRVQAWLEGPFDSKTKEQIRKLARESPQELADAFYQDLAFGTGGMRGLMGVGTSRINVYTIQMATQGLCQYLKMQPYLEENPSIFIGYDVRNHSRLFAEKAAEVITGNGFIPLLAKEVCPTPLVSFACRYFECSAAIMITASHNPPEYNGYKVYGRDGGQVVFPQDSEIVKEALKIQSPDQILTQSGFQEVANEIDVAYLKALQKEQINPKLNKDPLRILYTSLHGTGTRLFRPALESWGFSRIDLVEKQSTLDGSFPTAPHPNPEEISALSLGIHQMRKEKQDLLLATDPDADRMGAVVWHASEPVRLTGHQTACICLSYLCHTLKERQLLPPNAAFIKSIVTTELFRVIAETFECACFDVLTGFKYIAEKIHLWEEAFDSYQFLFGAEESYGALLGTFVRDKDAFLFSCLTAEAAAYAKSQGQTLVDLLEQLYATYGVYRQSLFSLQFPETQKGQEQMQQLMRRLRQSPLEHLEDKAVTCWEDYLVKKRYYLQKNHEEALTLPSSNVLRLWLEDQTKIVIRPSGTEPKIKVYLEVMDRSLPVVQGIARCDQRLKELQDALHEECKL